VRKSGNSHPHEGGGVLVRNKLGGTRFSGTECEKKAQPEDGRQTPQNIHVGGGANLEFETLKERRKASQGLGVLLLKKGSEKLVVEEKGSPK